MNILHHLRLFFAAQRLVPSRLSAAERDLRRWDALGDAYTALLEISSPAAVTSLEDARRIARESAGRVRGSCSR
jgi:hypothetical protein